MIRSPIHFLIFILIALFLAACGSLQTPLPSAIVLTDAPTHTAFPTTTATPSPGLFTAIHSQITYVPTKTPTATFGPTLLPTTPDAGAESYRLKELTQADAMSLVELMKEQAVEFWEVSACCQGIAFISQSRLALAAREALLRFPTMAKHEGLEWVVARALAHGRHNEASVWIMYLLEHALNEEHLDESHIVQLLTQHQLGNAHLIQADNLLGDGQPAFVLSVESGTGATFSISESSTGEYEVQIIDSLWSDDFVDEYVVSVGDHTADGLPEVTVSYIAYFGLGPSFSGAGLNIYQWQKGQWENLTNDLPNIRLYGYTDWKYIPTTPGLPDEIVVVSLDDGSVFPYSAWEKTYHFYWKRSHYHAGHIDVDIPDRVFLPIETSLMPEIWDWAEAESKASMVIPSMEKTLADWPAPDADIFGDGSTTFESWIGSAYHDYFQFQLGRMYNLAGYPDKATEVLWVVANQPYTPEYSLVPEMAKAYLHHLNQVDAADEAVIQILREASPCPSECSGLIGRRIQSNHFQALQFAIPTPTPIPSYLSAWEVQQSATTIFFSDQGIEQLIPLLQSTLSDPTLSCDDESCAYLLYLLGLAHELSGHEREAVQAYWQLWHDYPDSPYTLMARRKLEVITP